MCNVISLLIHFCEYLINQAYKCHILEVPALRTRGFLKRCALYKFTFYLLTYLPTCWYLILAASLPHSAFMQIAPTSGCIGRATKSFHVVSIGIQFFKLIRAENDLTFVKRLTAAQCIQPLFWLQSRRGASGILSRRWLDRFLWGVPTVWT